MSPLKKTFFFFLKYSDPAKYHFYSRHFFVVYDTHLYKKDISYRKKSYTEYKYTECSKSPKKKLRNKCQVPGFKLISIQSCEVSIKIQFKMPKTPHAHACKDQTQIFICCTYRKKGTKESALVSPLS